jgi:hypothetical protein
MLELPIRQAKPFFFEKKKQKTFVYESQLVGWTKSTTRPTTPALVSLEIQA